MEIGNDILNLQSFYPKDLQIMSVENDKDTIVINMKSRTHSHICPGCGDKMTNYHATHKRKVQDLPILGKTVFLKLFIYEYKCDNPECNNVSVTETFDGFLNHYSRMTERLVDFALCLAIETSCEGAARILKSLNVQISGDTIIRTLVKRYEMQEPLQCGSTIGVDDFSFKKRHTYGTIIVDGDTHEPLAVLDGRDGETLKEWLKQNKQVRTVTRDRASAYASAIAEILPDAMQIADRFHLHQNLLEAVGKVLGREIPATIAVPKSQEETVSSGECVNRAEQESEPEKHSQAEGKKCHPLWITLRFFRTNPYFRII